MFMREKVRKAVHTYYPHMCLVVFLAFWVLLAIEPVNRHDWLLENVLVILFVPFLIFTFKKLRLSNLSYTLLTIFLLLHLIGAHYTYGNVPIFDTLSRVFGDSRNDYDRIVHFSFGLCFFFPVKEWMDKRIKAEGRWSVFLPIIMVSFMLLLYELMEFFAALVVSPELGVAFIGAQGDVWDTQKDLLFGVLGALIAGWTTSMFQRSSVTTNSIKRSPL
jgi:putative membrane protein